jgi:beta-lactam-binding protein with PASTA domain
VVAQSPDNNKAVSPGATVTVRVSTGKEKLPDVRKKKLADALQQLNSGGFTNIVRDQTVTTHDKSKDGFVTDDGESPTPGIAYAADQKIELTVYRYKPLPPTCDPAKTPTPTGGVTTPLLPSGSITISTSPSTTPSPTSTNTLPACGQQ